MLTFGRHCYLSPPDVLLGLVLVFLEADAVGNRLHSFLELVQLVVGLGDGESVID